jgi:hypothetical protein
MRFKPLTWEEHDEIGALLCEIKIPLWDGRSKKSLVSRRCDRAYKLLRRFRNKMIDLADQLGRGSVYYDSGTGSPQEATADYLLIVLDRLHQIGNKLNSRVPAAVLDSYVRVEWALQALHRAIVDRDDDHRAAGAAHEIRL